METLENEVYQALLAKKYHIATAESCTGGLIAATIINVSGASDIMDEGYITYANSAKKKLLGVSEETLHRYGAVSEETAKEMAEGVLKASGAQVSVISTGIAGPTGGTLEKPVGLVYLACSVLGVTKVLKCHFEGDRLSVRTQATKRALQLVLECI